ncbi:Transcription elongation factor B polypeptide 3 [Myotis brandtii]|uniref:Transcription elongation factor B polypeptide 3 n=1 Tax=Myotis brandtii TaxID=109478 RepID=S7MSU4_MYOBR|nr:Transcription elongation factor B polypeptide 3 [Myotis brandtii]
MSGVHQRPPALAHEASRRPAEGRLAASPDRHLGAPQGRGEHPPSHKDHPPLGAQGQEEPSAGSTQRPGPASAREESPRPLCREGTAGKLSSRGAKKGKERGGRSSQRSKPPSEVASHNPEKKRKRKHSGEIQSHKYERRPHGLDAGEGPGGLPPKVREKVGDTCKTPEGKVKTPHLGRKPAGPPPEVEEELDPPIMSSKASLTPHQPPARKKRKSVKPPATALEGKSLRKEDMTGTQAEAGKSEKPFPPAAAGARLTQEPPAGSPA